MTDVSSITRQGWSFWMKLTTTSLEVTDSWEQSGCSTSGGTVAGRETPSRARNWAPVEHSEVTCLRRHMSDKARDFIGQVHPHGEQQGKGTQNSSAAAHSGFMVMGGVFGLSLASNSDSESFLLVHTLFSQDGCQRGFWEVSDMWCLLLTFPELFWLVVAY